MAWGRALSLSEFAEEVAMRMKKNRIDNIVEVFHQGFGD